MVRTTTAGAWIVVAAMGCEPASGAPPSQVSESDATDETATLEVEVVYRERMLLPPSATLEVVLEDGSKMDTAAERIAKTEVRVEGAPPYRVAIDYDPAKLDERGRYGVRARIVNEEQLMFTSTRFNPAFGTHGSTREPPNAPVEVLLVRVSSEARAAATSLTGTRWVVQTLRREPVGSGAGGRAPDLTLEGSEPRAHGFAGCNQFSGGYTLADSQLSFGQMAMTMRACPEGMDVEQAFAKALAEVRRLRVEGDRLLLLDGGGSVIIELAAG